MEEWASWTESEDNLRALLTFVDEFSENCTNEKEVASPDAVDLYALMSKDVEEVFAPLVPAKKAPCNRKREELMYLRSKAQELAYLLSKLENRDTRDAASTSETEPLAAVWESMARQQFELRHRAESENGRLRQSLQQQLKIAKSLQRALKRQANVQVVGAPSVPKRLRLEGERNAHGINHESPDDNMLAELSLLYTQLDLVFLDSRFETVESEFHDAHVCVDESGGTSFEFLSAKIVPFDLDTTAGVLWDFFRMRSQEEGPVAVTDHDTISVTVRGSTNRELIFHDVIVKADACFVARRYLEADRVVILSVSTMELKEAFGKQLEGVVLRHRAWRIVQRPRNHAAFPPDVTATQLQFHQVVTIEKRGAIPDVVITGETLEEYTVRVMNARFAAGHQTIENMLFDSSQRNK